MQLIIIKQAFVNDFIDNSNDEYSILQHESIHLSNNLDVVPFIKNYCGYALSDEEYDKLKEDRQLSFMVIKSQDDFELLGEYFIIVLLP